MKKFLFLIAIILQVVLLYGCGQIATDFTTTTSTDVVTTTTETTSITTTTTETTEQTTTTGSTTSTTATTNANPVYTELLEKIDDFMTRVDEYSQIVMNMTDGVVVKDESNNVLLDISVPSTIKMDLSEPYLEQMSEGFGTIVRMENGELYYYEMNSPYMVKQRVDSNPEELFSMYDMGIITDDTSAMPNPESFYKDGDDFCFSVSLNDTNNEFAMEMKTIMESAGMSEDDLAQISISGRFAFDVTNSQITISMSLENFTSSDLGGNTINVNSVIEMNFGQTFTKTAIDESQYTLAVPTNPDSAFQIYYYTDPLGGYVLGDTAEMPGFIKVYFPAGNYQLNYDAGEYSDYVMFIIADSSDNGWKIENNSLVIDESGVYTIAIVTTGMNMNVDFSFTANNGITVGDSNNPTVLTDTLTSENEGEGDSEYFKVPVDMQSMVEVRLQYDGPGTLDLNVSCNQGLISKTNVDGVLYYMDISNPGWSYTISVTGDYVGEYQIETTIHPTYQDTFELSEMQPITTEYDQLFFDGQFFIGPKGYFVIDTAGYYQLEFNKLNESGSYVPSMLSDFEQGHVISMQWNGPIYLEAGTYDVYFKSGYDFSIYQVKLVNTSQ